MYKHYYPRYHLKMSQWCFWMKLEDIDFDKYGIMNDFIDCVSISWIKFVTICGNLVFLWSAHNIITSPLLPETCWYMIISDADADKDAVYCRVYISGGKNLQNTNYLTDHCLTGRWYQVLHDQYLLGHFTNNCCCCHDSTHGLMIQPDYSFIDTEK